MLNYKIPDEVSLETMEELNRLYWQTIIIPYIKEAHKIDLHTHTNYSVGKLTIDELIIKGINERVKVLAITDYNTIDGLKEIQKNSMVLDSTLKIINGIELSSITSPISILGYDIDVNNKLLNKELIKLKDKNINAILFLIEQFKKNKNVIITYSDIKNIITTEYMMNVICLKRIFSKYAPISKEELDSYLEEYHQEKDYQYFIELIKNSDGIPVLGKPKLLNLAREDFEKLIDEMIYYGLEGIEVYHPSHNKNDINYYLEIANKYNLLISGGSDFTGRNVNAKLGLNTNKKLSLLNKLK